MRETIANPAPVLGPSGLKAAPLLYLCSWNLRLSSQGRERLGRRTSPGRR